MRNDEEELLYLTNEIIQLVETDINDVISNSFFEEEKIDLIKNLEYLKMNTFSLAHFMYSHQGKLNQIPKNQDLFVSISHINLSEIFQNYFELNDNNILVFSKVIVYLRKIIVILYLTTEKAPELIKQFEEYKDYIFLINERFPPNLNLHTKNEKFRVFQITEKKHFSLSKLNLKLKNDKIKFIDIETKVEFFEIVFNKRKLNNEFTKINWIGSIYELKKFINLLMEKEIIINGDQYLEIILDCFKVKGKDLKYYQILNPNGSKQNFELLESIIDSVLINTKKH